MKPYHYEWTLMVCLAIAVCQVLGDTEILVKEPREGDLWAWHTRRLLQEGAGWSAPSRSRSKYAVCDISTTKEPINWLRTDFIDVNDAKLLNIELRYTLRNCPSASFRYCKPYFSLYVFQTNTTKNPAPEPYQGTYQKIGTIIPQVLPLPDALQKNIFHATVATKAGGVYLAFLDQGACILLANVTVSFNYCSEISSDLVKFPRTVAPVNDSQLVEQTGECKANSVSKVKLLGACLSSGEWNITDGLECSCVAGYELVNGSASNSLQCNECPKGFYKSTVSNYKCLPCPANSASNTTRSGCVCSVGFYKLTEKIAPCKALPLAPLKAKTTVVKATYVAISWIRSPDDINGNIRYSVDCFRCKSGEDKECSKSCGPRVQYKPNKDSITYVTVKIHGLSSDRFFLFRIYSVNELNQQEKDRNKWKYAEVFVKTNTKALPLAPLKAYTTVVKATYVAISWTRSPDDISGNLRYSVDCFRCKSGEDKECRKSCGLRVQYKPNKDNISDVTVKIHGLSSDSFFLFRIYSVNELNQQEQDRNKWKYAKVFVKTKTKGHVQAFPMRWCTVSDKETEKCNAFKVVVPTLASATQLLSVTFSCVQGKGATDCMKKIQNGDADLITLDGGEIYLAGKNYSMVPIVAEDYNIGTRTTSYFAVAVVKKSNQGIKFTNLKGKKSCHTGAGKTAGWNVPVGLLLSKMIMTTDKSCSAYVAAGKFFNKSCVPNVKSPDFGSDNPDNLCALCPDECTKAGNYSGYSGAFKCLKDGLGDVAFVKHTTVPLAEAINYQYLCKDGSRADNYTNCYLDKVPSHAVMTKTGGDNNANFRKLLLKASENYGVNQSDSNMFQLFESNTYGGKDLLFKDSTKQLVNVDDKDTYQDFLGAGYLADIEALTACPTTDKGPTAGSKNTKLHLLAAMFSFIALLLSGALLK